MSDKLHDISNRLSAIAEEIADVALEELRESVRSGAAKPSERDKLLARARRSVEKAAVLLRADPPPD